MDPIVQNLASLTFLLTAESGIIISGFSRSTQRETVYVYDGSLGYDIGFVAHNPEANYSVNGKRSGSSALAAAAPATALTLAGPTTGNGVDDGTVFTLTVGDNHNEKAFRELAITAIQKPGITAA